MANTVFQKCYDAINKWSAPAWLKSLIQELNDIMIAILKTAGKSYINYVQSLIIEASQMKVSNQEKFQYVYKNATENALKMGIQIKDSEISALIEFLVSKFKKNLTI